MGYAIRIDEQQRRVTVVLSEVVTLDVLTGYVDALVRGGHWSWPQMIDTSTAIALELDPAEMVIFAQHVARHPSRGPVVMVAPTRGVTSIAQSLIYASRSVFPDRPDRRHIVSSIEAARAWLDSQMPAPTPGGGER